ncbi:MAG TPA: SRPBCC family protein [Parasegetibacter sp.]|jgi:type II secretory pathway pseudopilin PulG
MKWIKPLVLSVIVLTIVIFLFTLIFPSQVRISRAIDIAASRTQLHSVLSDLETWKEWYPAIRMDTVNQPVLNENKKRLSFGETEIQLLNSTDSSVTVNIRKGKSAQDYTINLIEFPQVAITTVQWFADVKVSWYPWERFGSMLFDKIMGPGFEATLDALKSYNELKQ